MFLRQVYYTTGSLGLHANTPRLPTKLPYESKCDNILYENRRNLRRKCRPVSPKLGQTAAVNLAAAITQLSPRSCCNLKSHFHFTRQTYVREIIWFSSTEFFMNTTQVFSNIHQTIQKMSCLHTRVNKRLITTVNQY